MPYPLPPSLTPSSPPPRPLALLDNESAAAAASGRRLGLWTVESGTFCPLAAWRLVCSGGRRGLRRRRHHAASGHPVVCACDYLVHGVNRRSAQENERYLFSWAFLAFFFYYFVFHPGRRPSVACDKRPTALAHTDGLDASCDPGNFLVIFFLSKKVSAVNAKAVLCLRK